jgi:hypothetical protein
MKLPIIFAIATGLFWGLYGPAVAQARNAEASPFKPYVLIGVAYLVWGILGGLIGMKVKGDNFTSWSSLGVTWGFIAGSLGAFGALALTLAMYNGGARMPHVVMPTVFGTAVAVSAIYGVATVKTDVNPLLYVGIVGMAACIVMVAYFTPSAHPPAKPGASPLGKPPAEAAATEEKVAR